MLDFNAPINDAMHTGVGEPMRGVNMLATALVVLVLVGIPLVLLWASEPVSDRPIPEPLEWDEIIVCDPSAMCEVRTA